MTRKRGLRSNGVGGRDGPGVKLEMRGEQLVPCVKGRVAQDMERPCHRFPKQVWPEDVFTLLASHVTAAIRAYVGAGESRRARLEAMYAAKAEHARAKAGYRQAEDEYQIAFRALQAAKARLGDAQRLYDNAFRDAYADWCARRLGSRGDRLQAVRELARIRGVSVRQMTRLLGYRAHRTSREVVEDLHRYRTGTTVLTIARERGISRQAVYDRFRAYKLKATQVPPSMREGLNGEIRGR